MRTSYIIVIALAFLALAACRTKLSVTVSVADKSKVKQIPQVQEAMNYGFTQAVVSIQQSMFLEKLSHSAKKAIRETVDQGVESDYIDRVSATGIRDNLINFTDREIGRLNEQLATIVHPNLDSTTLNYHAWVSSVYRFKEQLNRELEGSFEGMDNLFGILNQFQQSVDVAEVSPANRITQGYGTFGDPVVSYIIHAPEDIWTSPDDEMKGTFNRAQAKTRFGKADIAVVMEDVGQFYMKGARVDASETVQAITKSANMTLGLIANSTALPVNIPRPGAEGSEESFGGYDAIFEAELAKREFDNAQRLFRLNTASAIDAILLNAGQIQTTSDTAALVNSMQTIVNDYHTALNSITSNPGQ